MPVRSVIPSLLTSSWLFLLSAASLSAQPKKAVRPLPIPMEPTHWRYDSTKVEFITHRGVKAVRGRHNAYYQLFLKDHIFTDGTIEFDVELLGQGFPGINFRMSADVKNGENVYIRSFGPVPVETRTTLQYAPIVDGLSLWDLYDEYQTGALIYQQGWNHVKLVVLGQQLKVYVNDMKTPALHVPQLEATSKMGNISLSGNVIYANLTVDPARPEGVIAQAYHPQQADTRYLRQWQVKGPIDFPIGKDLVFPLPSMYGMLRQSDIPDSLANWELIEADHRALVNLSTRYGGVTNDGRRLAWLKTSIYSDRAQEKTLNLGFSDEVWLFVNGQICHVDKNYFGTPNAKQDGRCTLENAVLRLALKPGKNEILVGLANYFYGWGLVARLADTDGIRFTN